MSKVAAPRRYVSPLRYPGGKARIVDALADVYARTWDPVEVWMEPFAGGAGAGLTLLDRGYVEEVWLVEKHPAIAAFWRTVLQDGQRFAADIEATRPGLELWNRSRDLLEAVEAGERVDDFSLGRAAFIINRCSRSGIITPAAGPIGGKAQTGQWRLGDRFNAAGLADRIRHIAALAGRIRFWEGDAVDHIVELGDAGMDGEVFMFVDPPYLVEGGRLYEHAFTVDDHHRLAAALTTIETPWLLTYDHHPAIADLYSGCWQELIEMDYSANSRRRDTELVITSPTCPPITADPADVAA